ncbi:MAG TPA: L,D-transpeptidase [Thermosynechococcaceae cyanobacterium]|jgi:lipoprotein-anchoring transpeptidase ErfK/SrfK
MLAHPFFRMTRRSLKLITALFTTGLISAPTIAFSAPSSVQREIVQPISFSLPRPQLPPLAVPDFPTEPSDALMPLRLQIRLSRRQVTLYRGETAVKTYPIAVGRPGWETPTGNYQVRQMIKDPAWAHPLEQGVLIPAGDPENPLGRFWIGFWTDGRNWIGFHGTPNPKSVGTPASHGCIRMYNQDVEELFKQVKLGTEVQVVQ